MSYGLTHVLVAVLCIASFFTGIVLVDIDHIHSWEGAKKLWHRFWANESPKDNAEIEETHRGIFHNYKFYLLILLFVVGWTIHLLMDLLADLNIIKP